MTDYGKPQDTPFARKSGVTKTLWFTKDGSDIQDVELKNGKANPFGWSTHEVWVTEHTSGGVVDEHKIADLYCGSPINVAPGYSFRFEETK